MLQIQNTKDGTTLTITLSGRLDTTTAPDLEETLKETAGVTELIFNLASLEYISSAGLRVLLAAQKTMNKQGSMVLKNVNDTIKEVLDITGFSDILTIA